jgi:ribosome-binding protein aMBF1 (putative translation factor)
MADHQGLAHAEVRDRLLSEGSQELREEYARLELRNAAIGELLRARRARNLTQQMLAELAGVSQGVVSRLESGGHTPKLETLDQMARAMDYRLEVRLVDNRRSRAARNRRQTPA